MTLRFCLAIILFAQLTLAHGQESLTLVHDAKDHVVLEFSVQNFGSYLTPRADKKFVTITAPGVDNNADKGAPSIPHLSHFLNVPAGTKPRIKILSQTVKTQRLQAPIAPSLGRRTHCQPHEHNVAADEAAYSAAKAQPLVDVADVSFMGPLAVTMLTINPVQLTDDPLVIKTTTKILVRVDFQAHKRMTKVVNTAGLSPESYAFFKNMVVNRASLPTYKVFARSAVDFIITTPEFADALQPLLRLKAEQGRQVIVKTLDKPNAQTIQRTIQEQYKSDVVPTHTLLVGSINHLPSMRRDSYWSDYGYTLLDAGNYPDLSLGRIPARNVAELQNAVAKIVNRERTVRNNGAFLITSGFETSWCHQNLRFMMENIFAHSPVPLEITKLYASEGARTPRVLEAYNANPNVVIYDGHGDSTGMIEIPLVLNHLGGLRNTAFPLIMDIACLNSYWPADGATSRNFAESILTLNGTGAAGILAASSNSGGHDLFRHIFRASVFDEQDAQEPHHEINEIGQAVLYGKIKYLKQFNGGRNALNDNYMFYYHGDPSSTIFQHAE